MNKCLIEFCTEARFLPLKEYLNGVLVEDLVNFWDEDILETVDKKDRLLMKIFLRSTREQIESQITAQGVVLDGCVLDAHSRVCTSVFGSSLEPVNRVPVQQLLLSLPSEASFFPTVEVLDLSGNDLLTEDLIHIDEIVSALPNLKQIDLSYNRMANSTPDALEPLKRWLGQKQIKVHVLFNNFIDSQEFINSLQQLELMNLLWIPPNWLEGRGWTAKFASSERIQWVYTSHRHWYDNYARRSTGTGHTKLIQ
jgi:hypothetical protein